MTRYWTRYTYANDLRLQTNHCQIRIPADDLELPCSFTDPLKKFNKSRLTLNLFMCICKYDKLKLREHRKILSHMYMQCKITHQTYYLLD